MLKFCEEEVRLVEEVLSILEWDFVKEDDNYYHLYNELFPVMIGGKELILLEERMEEFDRNSVITFRPITNGRHVSLLMDFFYENEEDVFESIITGKIDEGKYFCRLIDFEGEVVKEVTSPTETSAKFKMFYEYYLEANCDNEIISIKRYEDRIRRQKELNNNADNNKKNTVKKTNNRKK